MGQSPNASVLDRADLAGQHGTTVRPARAQLDDGSLHVAAAEAAVLPAQSVRAAVRGLGLADDAERRPPCLAAGTRVLATRGWVAVEALQAGDELVTAEGAARRLEWIGWRDVNCRRQVDPALVQPIRVRAGAFGPDLPLHDVLLSPDQALFVEDVLVPVGLLANGATLRRENPAAIRYYHLGLPGHDVVLAEGLPVETDPRPDPTIDVEGRVSGAATVAPACSGKQDCGIVIRQGRAHLLARADLLGYRMTQDADLHLLADGTRVWGSLADGVWRGWVPEGVRELRIVSRAAAPADCHPDSDDQRRLGVALRRIVLGLPLGACSLDPATSDPRASNPCASNPCASNPCASNWGDGFYATETDGARHWRWTNGGAVLNPALWGAPGSPFRLELHLLRTLTYRLEEPANLAAACADSWLA